LHEIETNKQEEGKEKFKKRKKPENRRGRRRKEITWGNCPVPANMKNLKKKGPSEALKRACFGKQTTQWGKKKLWQPLTRVTGAFSCLSKNL